jgi:hypothetical protein
MEVSLANYNPWILNRAEDKSVVSKSQSKNFHSRGLAKIIPGFSEILEL